MIEFNYENVDGNYEDYNKNHEKDIIMLQLLQDTQFILEMLIKKISIVEAKLEVKQNYSDDEVLRSLMMMYNKRKSKFIELVNDEKDK
ncbi:hypothetical protein [Clostridium folliculivorans]|uniref:Uncharacterized protein n=1 Tax=Clostridium folliculivorans TaxID=2886038 RepID=A0A9W6DAW8_9CLOT|nr:hypothetical protein [Clostridium folliculivorans]GKU25262.1 hypothetical protein CFOLD11_20880 [Clostridium folliculivorans]GKU28283.1 hypothetical protein CFB3_03890 [Clostridium folliculivorans]